MTCWVPSVTRFAFFDGIRISIYLHECTFIYLDFSIVLCKMKTKTNLKLETTSGVQKMQIYDTLLYLVNCCCSCYYTEKLHMGLNLVPRWFYESALSKFVANVTSWIQFFFLDMKLQKWVETLLDILYVHIKHQHGYFLQH